MFTAECLVELVCEMIIYSLIKIIWIDYHLYTNSFYSTLLMLDCVSDVRNKCMLLIGVG